MLHKESRHDLYRSSYVVSTVTSRGLRYAWGLQASSSPDQIPHQLWDIWLLTRTSVTCLDWWNLPGTCSLANASCLISTRLFFLWSGCCQAQQWPLAPGCHRHLLLKTHVTCVILCCLYSRMLCIQACSNSKPSKSIQWYLLVIPATFLLSREKFLFIAPVSMN
jgi:hypothetical protein